MKKYELELHSPMSKSFMAVRAANSMDIDVEAKSVHKFSVTADVDTDFNVGLVVGASGSGKSSLANRIWSMLPSSMDKTKAIVDQFPSEMKYDEVANVLNGIGLTSVPCWIKPVGVLSNGQQARCEAALAICRGGSDVVCIDEWTSVVDRTVAKVMSHCVQKFARKLKKKIVLISCHYDVVEWLMPDWIIDCNSQSYEDRRGLRWNRTDRLQFEIREVSRRTWKNFSKYHYLSGRPPTGLSFCFGLFYGGQQVGFQAFSNYIPIRPGSTPIFHSNRTVVHPDFAGLGLGLKMINECCKLMKRERTCEIRAKFSSEPLYRARLKDPTNWKMMLVKRTIGKHKIPGSTMSRKGGFRENVKTYTFRYIGE